MYAPVVPSKTIPDSRPKWAKCFQTKKVQSLFSSLRFIPSPYLSPYFIPSPQSAVRSPQSAVRSPQSIWRFLAVYYSAGAWLLINIQCSDASFDFVNSDGVRLVLPWQPTDITVRCLTFLWHFHDILWFQGKFSDWYNSEMPYFPVSFSWHSISRQIFSHDQKSSRDRRAADPIETCTPCSADSWK